MRHCACYCSVVERPGARRSSKRPASAIFPHGGSSGSGRTWLSWKFPRVSSMHAPETVSTSITVPWLQARVFCGWLQTEGQAKQISSACGPKQDSWPKKMARIKEKVAPAPEASQERTRMACC